MIRFSLSLRPLFFNFNFLLLLTAFHSICANLAHPQLIWSWWTCTFNIYFSIFVNASWVIFSFVFYTSLQAKVSELFRFDFIRNLIWLCSWSSQLGNPPTNRVISNVKTVTVVWKLEGKEIKLRWIRTCCGPKRQTKQWIWK